MAKHPRSVRRPGLVVECLEERWLLSGGGLTGHALSALTVAVAARQTAVDPEDRDVVTAATAQTSGDPEDEPQPGARSATASSNPLAADSSRASTSTPVVTTAGVFPAGSLVSFGSETSGGLASNSTTVVHPLGPGTLDQASAARPATIVPAPEGHAWPGDSDSLTALETGLRGVPPLEAQAPAGTKTPARAAARKAVAAPHGFPLIVDMLPIARDRLERAVSQFLTRVADLSGGRARWSESPATVISLSVLLVVAAVRDMVRWPTAADPAGDEEQESGSDVRGDEPGPFGRIGRHGLPGLPSAS